MNNLLYFSHDSDAHLDPSLIKVMRACGGMKAYGVWWVLVELLARYGNGDQNSVETQLILSFTRVYRPYLLKVLASFSSQNLVSFEFQGGFLHYKIPLFRERNEKLKCMKEGGNINRNRNINREAKDFDTPPTPKGGSIGFTLFWKNYPKKVAREPSLKAWIKLSPSDSLLKTILAALERQKESEQWKKGFIPNPLTWLNQKRWEDELEAKKHWSEV